MICRLLLFIATCLLLSSPSFAALGGDDSSIQRDSRATGTQRTVTQHGKYSVHEIAPKKYKLHQFMDPNGKVFALSWTGRTHPDLSTLLGVHFQKVQDAIKAARQNRHGRAPLVIDVDNIHLEMSGTSMSMQGRVWLADQVPSGVSTDELR